MRTHSLRSLKIFLRDESAVYACVGVCVCVCVCVGGVTLSTILL